MRPEFETPLRDFLVEVEDDYIGLWEIINDVSRALKLDKTKMTLTDANRLWQGVQEFITLMLQHGFFAIDMTDGGGYEAWPDQSPEVVIKKVKERWISVKKEMPNTDAGFSVWFYKLPKNL